MGYESDDEPRGCFDDKDYYEPSQTKSIPISVLESGDEILRSVPVERFDGGLSILELTGNRRTLIEELMRRYRTPGIQHVTEKTRLNLAVYLAKLEVVGFTAATPDERERNVHINWVYVAETEQGKGIGKKLWRKVLSQFPGATFTGDIVDRSGRMEALAKKDGALRVEDKQWVLDITERSK